MRGTSLEQVPSATAQAVKSVAKTLGFYLHRQEQYARDRGHAAKPGSPADRVAHDRTRQVPYEVASLLNVVADDHLRTLGATLDVGVVPSYAGHSLLRVVLETSARSWWVLAPGLDDDGRAARGLLARLEMLRERAKLERGSGNAAERIEQQMLEAEAAGFTIDVNDAGQPKKVNGMGHADTTSVLREMLPDPGPETGMPFGEFLFRVLSGATHGNEWMTLLNAEPVAETHLEGRVLVRTTADVRQLGWLLTAAVTAHAGAFDRMARLHGWASFVQQPFYRRAVIGRLNDAVDGIDNRAT